MQKLHLIGFTTDHDGLILSARKTARSGGYVLNVDETLAEAVDAYRARQEELKASRNGRPDREESKLGISEIQARLRRGKSVKDIAKDAGVSPEWVERFAAPVVAERARVIDYVRNAALRRPRLGASAMRVGDAIKHNLADRGVALSAQEFAEGWTTVQQPNGKWVVRFKVRYRGADKTLRYDLAGVGQEIVAKDQLTRQLSYVAPPPKKPTPRPAPNSTSSSSATAAEEESKKRAQVSTGFRPEVVKAKPTSTAAKERDRAARAMNQAAVRRAGESEKAAARKARERAQALAKREREAKAEAARREKEAAQRAKEAAAAARAAAVAAAKREREEAAAAEARRAAREEAREAARQKAIQAVRKRPAAKKTTKPKAADKSRTAAEVRKRSAAAEEASRTRADKARPASTTTAAKRATAAGKAAPRPTGKPVKAGPPPAKAAAKTTKTAAKATKAPARKSGSPLRANSPLRDAEPPPSPAARVDPAKLGGATDSYGPEAQRALFRAGLAEPASGDDVTAETPRPGTPEDRPARFMGRRRRRQLRAD